MSDESIIVLTPPDLENGFLLTGAATIVEESPDAALAELERLMSSHTEGVVAVFEPFLTAMDPEDRARIDASVAPVVVPFPPGLRTPPEEERRARFAEMLSRAVGYRITFRGEEET